MVRKHFYLPQEQLDWLKEKAEYTDLTVSEVVRMIIHKHIMETSAYRVSTSESKKGGKNG